jgi:hypothetical protein
MWLHLRKEGNKMKLTYDQYFKIKALFNLAAKEKGNIRPALSQVFYNHTEKHFAVTNGHALRLLDSSGFDIPEYDFQLAKKQFLLSGTKFETTYGINGNIDIEIDEQLNKDYPYVQYMRTIPTGEIVSLESIALCPKNYMDFGKTFFRETLNFRLKFYGETKGVIVCTNDDDEKLLGIVMPLRRPVRKSRV